MKVKMPLKYLSYSAWELYRRDPMGFYQQYFVGRLERPTPKMILGSIFQEAWADPKYDYSKALKEAGFTSDCERIIRTALGHRDTVRMPKSKCERKHEVQGNGLAYKILAIYDGEDQFIVENKFGNPWSQKQVDESNQITWYALVRFIETGKIPKILLQSFNSKNGQPRHYWVTRTRLEIDKLVREINKTVEKIEAGDFSPVGY